MTPVETVLAKLPDHRPDGKGWKARCPAHDDHNPSLSISEGDGGRALVFCHVGCTQDAVVSALGLRMSDLRPPTCGKPQPRQPGPRQEKPTGRVYPTAAAAVADLDMQLGTHSGYWPYMDAAGNPAGLVVRWDKPDGKKTIRPVTRLGPDCWKVEAMPFPRPLYRLPELADAKTVVVTEGEKCADAAHSLGFTATTSTNGAQSPEKTDWQPLAGKEVLILPDNDDPGRKYAAAVVGILAKLDPPPVVKIVELPGLPAAGDIVDWLATKGDAAEPDQLRAEILGMAGAAEPIPEPAADSGPKPRWPAPVPISQLPTSGPVVDWIVNGLLARRHITMLSALMKAGKTTFVSHLLRSLQSGRPFIGRDARECRTLFVSEESHNIWRGRRDALALDDHLSLLCKPMLAKPSFPEWIDFVQYVTDCARGFDLVVFDTIGAFAPWKNENDAAEVTAAITPLNRLTAAGLGVGFFHHHGKADSGEGRAARGSTALAGAVDIMLELRRFKPDDLEDRRRVLSGLGRFDEIPLEAIITLEADGSGYSATGDRKQEAARELQAMILDVLPDDVPGLTANDIHAGLPELIRPQISAVSAALRAGAERGLWQTGGTGRKGDPRRFWLPVRNSSLAV